MNKKYFIQSIKFSKDDGHYAGLDYYGFKNEQDTIKFINDNCLCIIDTLPSFECQF